MIAAICSLGCSSSKSIASLAPAPVAASDDPAAERRDLWSLRVLAGAIAGGAVDRERIERAAGTHPRFGQDRAGVGLEGLLQRPECRQRIVRFLVALQR